MEKPSARVKRVGRGVERWRALHEGSGAVATEAPAGPPDPVVAQLDEILDSPLGKTWLADGLAQKVEVRSTGEGIRAPLPRRAPIGKGNSGAQVTLPRAKGLVMTVPPPQIARRLVVWIWFFVRYLAGKLVDELGRKRSSLRRAQRLRGLFERSGPSFIKIGQHLSIRADFLPYAHCAELWKIVDEVPPFDSKHAVAAIERAAGKEIGDVFAVFDPQPIASTAIACVYQALLNDGQKVAVKVRRPDIKELLAADLAALELILQIGEALTIVRPGTRPNVLRGLTAVLEEADLAREARYCVLFRNRADKAKKDWLSSPRVYRKLSSEEVLVTEFVSGVFVSEILKAKDRKDEKTLSEIHAAGVDERVIAKRLAELFHWELMESLLFNADPRPENLVALPGNKVVVLDFGLCGRLSSKGRRLWHELHRHMAEEDVQRMVECSISMLEPLPHIDVPRYHSEVEQLYWDSLYRVRDSDAPWWERTRGLLWLKFASAGRHHQLPINLDLLRLFRAVFLYDAAILCLDNDLEVDAEYARYNKKAGRKAKRRVRKSVRQRLVKGPANEDYMMIEAVARQANQLLSRVQRELDQPRHEFVYMVSKAAYAATMVLRVFAAVLVFHLIAVLIVAAIRVLTGLGNQISAWETLVWIVSQPVYQISLVAAGIFVIRKALMRLEDLDVYER